MKGFLTKTIFAIGFFAISTHPIKSQNKTILITESNLPYTSQTLFYSGLGKALQESEIKKHWDEGRRITSAAYTRNGWFVTMAKGTGIGMQTYNTSSDWPTEWIKKKWDENYRITSLSRSDNQWLVVMSQGAGYMEQTYNRDTPDNLTGWIKENWNKGFYITDIAYDGAKWAMVMSKHPKYTDQGLLSATDYSNLQSKIKTDVWDKGYRVQSIESGDDEYLIIYCKYRDYNGRSQQYQVDPSNVNDFIQKIWNQSQNIAYIGGGYPAQTGTPNNPSNEGVLKFTTFEKTISLTGPEGGDTGLVLKIDYPSGTGEINNKVVNGIKQMVKNSLVGGAIGTSTVGTINTVCNNMVSDYKQGVAKGNLESDGVSYIYCLEKEYHNSQVACYHITDGIFSNGGPQEAYAVIRLSDGKVLDMADLFSMSYEDGIRLIRQHGTQEDRDALDGDGMGVSSIYISRDDKGWKIVYLVGVYFYNTVRISSSAIKPYLTAEGGK